MQDIKPPIDSNDLQTFVTCDILPLLGDDGTNKSADDVKSYIGKLDCELLNGEVM